eukprot:s886_g17.t1
MRTALRVSCLVALRFLCQAKPVPYVACLDNAIAVETLKDLVSPAGESYPIGIWVNDWAAGHLAAEVAQIVIQEKLGYNVKVKGPGGLAVDGFFALTGCVFPTNNADRGCNASTIYVHINFEVWTSTYSGDWDRIQTQFPEMAPKNLGFMGYYGATAMYIPLAVQERGYDSEGINLDFYRDYNASKKNPSKFFAAPSDLSVSRLRPCNETALMLNEVMSNYWDITGDSAGVVGTAPEITGRCWDTYFWYAPGCRLQPANCLTWFTGGTGWGMFEMLVKATTYNMPLATAVADSFADYARLPTTNDVMLYWWVPDPTFLRLAPRRVTFPEHDADEWAKGN